MEVKIFLAKKCVDNVIDIKRVSGRIIVSSTDYYFSDQCC